MKKPVTKKVTKRKPLTPAQMRVAIAKDVIKQIIARKMIINNGVYFRPTVADQHVNKAVANEKGFQCRVCAVGAAIVSGIRLFNEVEFRVADMGVTNSFAAIQNWFRPSQAALIEAGLEGEASRAIYRHCDVKVSKGDMKRADAFYWKHQNMAPEDVVIAIYKNIIRNKGEFKP